MKSISMSRGDETLIDIRIAVLQRLREVVNSKEFEDWPVEPKYKTPVLAEWVVKQYCPQTGVEVMYYLEWDVVEMRMIERRMIHRTPVETGREKALV